MASVMHDDVYGVLIIGASGGVGKFSIQNMCNEVFYCRVFYTLDGLALDEVSQLLDAGKATFPFSQVPQAFQKLERGHTKGKMVVIVVQEDEGTPVTEEEGEVETSNMPDRKEVREEVKEATLKR